MADAPASTLCQAQATLLARIIALVVLQRSLRSPFTPAQV
jgi:hypothetical protein